MIVRLTHLDGKLPNLALMKLAAWHRDRGDEVRFSRDIERGLLEPAHERVYGSSIFAFSRERLKRFQEVWPESIVGGTGTYSTNTVEDLTGALERYDYSIYPEFRASIGFTQRGCRLRCKFCVVPEKEGRPRSVNRIQDIWRGEPHPKHLHLLDNDFFGQAEWRSRIREIRDGGFKVCFNQGINVRLVTEEVAEALASVQYRDDQFQRRRLYTAWDNLRDEEIFFAGASKLEAARIPARHIMAYMLVGFDPSENMERIMYRFERMVERGILPYPMVYDRSRADLRAFQRWAVTGLYRAVPFSDYKVSARAKRNSGTQFQIFAA
jgi:hypothetical protein